MFNNCPVCNKQLVLISSGDLRKGSTIGCRNSKDFHQFIVIINDFKIKYLFIDLYKYYIYVFINKISIRTYAKQIEIKIILPFNKLLSLFYLDNNFNTLSLLS